MCEHMPMKKVSINALHCLLLLHTLFPALAAAELYRCSGVWTNKPCENGSAEKVLPDYKRPTRSEEEVRLARKRAWLEDLEIRLTDLRARYDLTVSSSIARDICTRPETSLDECQSAINGVEKQVSAQLAAAQAAEPPARRAERVYDVDPPARSEPAQSVVIVNNEQWWWSGRDPHHDHHRRPHPPIVSQPRAPRAPRARRPPLKAGIAAPGARTSRTSRTKR